MPRVVSRHDSTATVSCLMAWEADCALKLTVRLVLVLFCASSVMATSSGSQVEQEASHAITSVTSSREMTAME